MKINKHLKDVLTSIVTLVNIDDSSHKNGVIVFQIIKYCNKISNIVELKIKIETQLQ